MDDMRNASVEDLRETINQLRHELKEVHGELDLSNQELMQLTLEMDDRVAERTAELQRLHAELENHRDNLQSMVEAQSREITAANDQLRERLKALEASEQRFQTVLDGFSEIVYVSDPETYELLYTNLISRDRLHEFVGQRCHYVIHGSDAPCDFCGNHAPDCLGEARVWERHDPVKGRWHRCTSKLINWPDGRTVRFELMMDVTDIKEAQDILLRSMVSRELVGEIIQYLKERYGLRDRSLVQLGRDMASNVSGKSMDDFIGQFSSMGFGELHLEQHRREIKRWIFTGDDLVEARGEGRLPADHFTLGYLCGMIEKLSGAKRALGVELECQSVGDPLCRFIIQER